MRVLVTGAAGSVGRMMLQGLPAHGHELTALDLAPAPEGVVVPWWTVDCTDQAAVDEAVAATRPDAVVHLAAVSTEADLPSIASTHLLGTAAVAEAMVAHGVQRIVFASSNHAVGRTPRAEAGGGTGRLSVEALPRPDTFYGVGKVASEALLHLYADRHGLDVVACRIGSCVPEPESTRHLSTWLSPADAVRMVHAGLTCPAPGFAVIHGISANTRAWWDLAPGRALGYDPQDNAEEFAGRIPARPEDEAEGAHVGGPFATPAFDRPAFSDGDARG